MNPLSTNLSIIVSPTVDLYCGCGGAPVTPSKVLLETGDGTLLETGDFMLLES